MASGTILSPDETLAARWEEARYAWVHISQHPFLGIGIRTPYRPEFFPGDELTYYIHNSYIWLWLHVGLLGILSFLWLSFAFLKRGFQSWHTLSDPSWASTMLGFTLAYAGMMISNLVAPSFTQHWNACLFAIIMAINEAILTISRTEGAFAQGGQLHVHTGRS